MTARHLDGPVPGYLGRVLASESEPVGTCFQVAPGVLVTAWHVLDDVAAAVKDAQVLVEPLAGGESFEATVTRLDQVHDLAVLTCGDGLPGTAGQLVATDQMAPGTQVTVTGHCVIDDSGHTARSLTTIGQWAGPATWEDAMPTGRMTAEGLLPGMSGAPVIPMPWALGIWVVWAGGSGLLVLVTLGSSWSGACQWPACRAGGRPAPRADGRCSRGRCGISAGQAAGLLARVMTASAIRVPVSARVACSK